MFDAEQKPSPGSPIQARAWGRIKRTYIRLTKDTSMPVALQNRFIKEADALTPDNRFNVRTLEAAHIEPLVRPEPLAEVLAGLAGS